MTRNGAVSRGAYEYTVPEGKIFVGKITETDRPTAEVHWSVL